MIFANPFVRAAPPVNRRIPIKGRKFNFTDAEQLVDAQAARYAKATRLPLQRNYNLTRGQTIAIAETNRKRVLQGGPLPAYRIPSDLRNRYHPNSTDLSGLGVLPFLPVGFAVTKSAILPAVGAALKALPIVGGLFKSNHTPEQVAANVNRVVASFQSRTKLPPFLKTPVASVPTVVQGASSSGEFYNVPAEFEPVQRSVPDTVSVPQVDTSSAPVNQASIMGSPGLLLAAGAVALLLFSSKKH